jgi:microcystin-dependent protein
MEGVMAVVTCFAGNFNPKSWQPCNGQILPISTNQALFALIGTTYGGNGVNTFGLPDLRGRTAVSTGQGPGLPPFVAGQMAGSEHITLTVQNLAPHNHNGNATHSLPANTDPGIDPTPNNGYPSSFTGAFGLPASANATMIAPNVTIGITGNSAPVDIRTPYLAINYIICVQGIFPSRN